jgi:hypothetical protein
MILRELATAWVRANCPNADLQRDVLQWLDEAIGQGVGCSFMIGRNLTKSGTPYLVHCFCGELFAFPLTLQQASGLNLGDSKLVSARGLTAHAHEPRPSALVTLEQVAIDGAEALDRSQPIKGTLKYRTNQLWSLPLALVAVCEPPGRMNVLLYYHLNHLAQGEGEMRFQLPVMDKLRNREGGPFTGVLPLFFQINIVGEPEKGAKTAPGTPAQAHRSPPISHAGAPPPVVRQKIGEPFIPTSPPPTLMTPATMVPPSFPAPWSQEAESRPNPNRLRAISDIHAVLVEIAEPE